MNISTLTKTQSKFIGYTFEAANGAYEKQQSAFKTFIKMFFKNKLATLGVVIITIMVLGAIIIPFVSKDPQALNPDNKSANIFSSGAILGTDQQGRDIWARLWMGLRFSLGIAAMATIVDVFVGLVIGLYMGYSEKFDKFMMFIIKILSNIPSTLILIMVAIVLTPNFWVVVFALTVTGWMGMAVQIRAQVLRVRNRDWVVASITLGTPQRKIIRSLVPVVIPIVITQLVFTIPGAILGEASLGFIGLSIPDQPTIGNLINAGKEVFQLFPRYVIIPATSIIFIVVSVQFIGNGIQESLRRQR